MSLQPTDLFAVQRGAITYKTPFSDIQDYVTDQLKATWLPSHLDNPSSVGTSTWNGPADTLAATGSIEVSISGGPFGSGGAVASPTQIQVRWKAADVAGAAHDATLTGRIQNTTGSVAVDYAAKVDKLPDPITINGKTGVTPSAAVDSDASSPVNGINAQARLWLNTTDGTSPMVSIAGGAWTAVPTTTAGALPIDAGQTFKLRHTAKAGASVKTTTTVYVGWAAASSAQVAFATTNAATKAPVIGTVTLADSPEADRFTSATFDTTVTMTDEGLPTSTKGLKAWVEGTLKTAAVSSAITAVNKMTTPDLTAGFRQSGAGWDTGFSLPVGGTTYTSGGPGNLFDKDPTTAMLSQARGPQWWELHPSSDIKVTSLIEVDVLSGWAGSTHWKIGVGTNTATATAGTDNEIMTLKLNYSGVLSTSSPLRVQIVSSQNDVGLWTLAVRVDGAVLVSGQEYTTLTLADTTNLAKFAPGDAVTEVTSTGTAGDASGTVGVADATAKTITLATSSGTWDVGSKVKSPPKTQTVTVTPNSDEITAVNTSGAQPVLTFKTDKDLAKFAGGDAITQGGGGTASGTVGSVDVAAKTMTLATSTGTWGPANAGHHVIGPTKQVPVSNVKLYCKLDASLNVTDLQSADPGYTAATGVSPYKLTWPATLPSGQPPDTDLPAGTTLTTEVQATNTAGTVHKTSNTITPA